MIFDELKTKIDEQRKGHEEDAVYYCGEQILDICRGSDNLAEIVFTDLNNAEMTVEKCAKAIKDVADKIEAKRHKMAKDKTGFCCITPHKAEEIIRKFYGLPGADDEPEIAAPVSAGIDLTAYL